MPTWDTVPPLASLMTMAPVPAKTRANVPTSSAASLRIESLAPFASGARPRAGGLAPHHSGQVRRGVVGLDLPARHDLLYQRRGGSFHRNERSPAVSERVVEQVRSKYAAVAASALSGEQAGVRAVAEAFGYSPEELASVPAEANMGLSCGNPTAFARLRPGETVVDLGCGGGLDVLLAAAKVGPTGKAVGIDMTPEMIERARRNAARGGPSNVEFHLATIDKLPLPNVSVDCVISNCVINLAPDK